MCTGSGWQHPALRNLIEDHRRLLQEADAIKFWIVDSLRDLSVDEISTALHAFWELHGLAHLREEEEILFPLCRAYIPEWAEFEAQIVGEHHRLREQVAQLLALSPSDARFTVGFDAIYEFLRNHCRHEERVVYALISEKLPDAQWQEYEHLSRFFREQHRPSDAHWDQPFGATDDNA
ncbi:MAG: hemerythrin domain-containing protein [Anaerolinea sp.]|nr:hemerythrin domain-containing protein [Anaerolinea sp.]MCC6974947.1 hemerythrin domain-containing protein [Anaerolineae bacterium]CAG1015601.1 hypothetical protein ANRL4_05537 [Anaerolineae bacterium]